MTGFEISAERKHEAMKRILWVLSKGSNMKEDYYENLTDIRNAALSLRTKQKLIRNIKARNPKFPLRLPDSSKNVGFFKGWKLPIWRPSTQGVIEGRYGSSVYSVFKFKKWIIKLNALNFLLIFLLIFIPHAVEEHSPVDDLEDTCPIYEYKYVPIDDNIKCCSALYNSHSEKAWEIFHNPTFQDFGRNSLRFFKGLIQGTNWASFSPFFYGFYGGTYRFSIGSTTYDFPLAYFLVMIALFLINLSAVVISSTQSFKSVSYDQRGDRRLSLLNIIFAGWNFYDVKTPVQKRTLRTAFRNVFLLALKLANRAKFRGQMTRLEKYKRLVIRIGINSFVVIILSLVAFWIFQLNAKVIPNLIEKHECGEQDEGEITSRFTCFGIRYLSAFTILACNTIFPFIFDRLVQFEDYETKTTILVQIGRNIFVRLGTLILTYWSLFRAVNCQYIEGCANTNNGAVTIEDCKTQDYLIRVKACTNENNDLGICKKNLCWETFIGQQFYTLAIMDFVANAAFIYLIDLPRSRIFTKVLPFMGCVEFNIGKHVLDAVDSQTIVWLSIFYAPFISLLICILNFATYHIKIFYVLKVCKPAFSESKASPLFKYFLLLSYFFSIIAVGTTLATIEPSLSCGPFRNVECSKANSKTNFCIGYDYVIATISRMPPLLRQTFFFLGDNVVLLGISVVLLVLFYFSYASMSSNRKLLSELEIHSTKITEDKKNLFKALEHKET